ncbi:DUF2201 family putative metallopeptidase [Pseudorhodoplanes sp.]|uniref:vWA domain-containing protein n=1 Tax=Pseudorhodoplanes sp. TaxID=1934341 RepID=UPI00391D8C55
MSVAAAKPVRQADSATLHRIAEGLRMVTVPLPHLAGLAAAVHVALDRRVPTMGIFASGRLIANPDFVARLKDNELVFVLAHELLHLALRTHDRARGSGRLEFNYAHDYIINDILRGELGFAAIPAGGLDMPGAKARSAEDIVIEMRRNADLMRARTSVWEGKDASVRQALGQRPGTGDDTAGDVLADEKERDMFPADAQDQAQQKAAIEAAIARARVLAAAIGKQRAHGNSAGGTSAQISALRGQFRPAWQAALQRWIESSAMAERSFTRPSRRGRGSGDLVMPGRRRASWMLTVLLDTSGSMTEHIPVALGAIADFCEAAGVDQIRVVQCDVAVTADDTVPPDALASYPVTGFGGSDLSPAMRALDRDPLVRAVVIITDGDIVFPQAAPAYGVLWVLPRAGLFAPPYGRVIAIDGSRL